MKAAALGAVVLAISACGGPAATPTATPVTPAPSIEPRAAAAPPATFTLSILGTNDTHGALDRLPILAGFVANLRAARAADHGAVLVLDAGDLFQGTIESNLSEGGAVIKAFNLIGYDAAAVGNHEFDYGPVGPDVTAVKPGEDPRGALAAAMGAASFPFLSANIVDAATNAPPAWPNFATSTLIERNGVKIGLIGASTSATPHTTMPANFVGLAMTPAAAAITREAAALRGKGAQIIVVTAHLGTQCHEFTHPEDDSSCDHTDELYDVLRAVPHGTVDVLVAGHTHAGIAHMIEGVAVIESYASARAFGRVDLTVGADGKIRSTAIQPPHDLCTADHGKHDRNPAPAASCEPGDYEGKPVTSDPGVTAIVDDALASAARIRGAPLGAATLTAVAERNYDHESAVGNLFADLMHAAHPEAAAALTNGGGLRADLPAGPFTYGALYEAMPFDNRFTLVSLTGAQIEMMVKKNLAASAGIFSWSGLRVTATCNGSELAVKIAIAGKPLVASKTYTVATSDFLASGGDDVFKQLALPRTAMRTTDVLIREAMADQLRKLKGPAAQLDPAKLFDRAAPRQSFPGERPVKCGGAR